MQKAEIRDEFRSAFVKGDSEVSDSEIITTKTIRASSGVCLIDFFVYFVCCISAGNGHGCRERERERFTHEN